jgi:selT/selW/selH-like putative selenoprotein
MERGAEEVELVKGVAGVFEITVDGRLAFSKKQLGRFPEDRRSMRWQVDRPG